MSLMYCICYHYYARVNIFTFHAMVWVFIVFNSAAFRYFCSCKRIFESLWRKLCLIVFIVWGNPCFSKYVYTVFERLLIWNCMYLLRFKVLCWFLDIYILILMLFLDIKWQCKWFVKVTTRQLMFFKYLSLYHILVGVFRVKARTKRARKFDWYKMIDIND